MWCSCAVLALAQSKLAARAGDAAQNAAADMARTAPKAFIARRLQELEAKLSAARPVSVSFRSRFRHVRTSLGLPEIGIACTVINL